MYREDATDPGAGPTGNCPELEPAAGLVALWPRLFMADFKHRAGNRSVLLAVALGLVAVTLYLGFIWLHF